MNVLPYQELLGNYNRDTAMRFKLQVLPYQELLGNYNINATVRQVGIVLPYQELLGNYNLLSPILESSLCFTIPRTARELQLHDRSKKSL